MEITKYEYYKKNHDANIKIPSQQPLNYWSQKAKAKF